MHLKCNVLKTEIIFFLNFLFLYFLISLGKLLFVYPIRKLAYSSDSIVSSLHSFIMC